MFLVPVLVASDEADADSAERRLAAELHDRALHVGGARRLSQPALATADFELRVYAKGIELPPAAA